MGVRHGVLTGMLLTSSRLGVQEIMRTIVTAKGDDDSPRGSRAHDQHGYGGGNIRLELEAYG